VSTSDLGHAQAGPSGQGIECELHTRQGRPASLLRIGGNPAIRETLGVSQANIVRQDSVTRTPGNA
jgi:hypothetical protein